MTGDQLFYVTFYAYKDIVVSNINLTLEEHIINGFSDF